MYPSKQLLEEIENFDIEDYPIFDLIRLVYMNWRYSEDGGFKITFKKDYIYVQFHTMGWSGNEELYDSFCKIPKIGLFWQKTERGGHYYYIFPRFAYEKGLKNGSVR